MRKSGQTCDWTSLRVRWCVETQPPTELYGNDYCLISVDLRQPDQFSQKLTNQTTHERLFDPTCSTLIIAELVFLYMSPEQTESCLRRLTSIFEGKLMIITYEALNLNDNFSKMMVQNLSARGLSLPGFDYNSSVESQIRRFHDLGFTEIVSSDMKKLRESNGDDRDWRTKWDQELKRIKGLEFLDEVEELELVLQHYAISWATKGFVESPTQSNQNFRLPNLTWGHRLIVSVSLEVNSLWDVNPLRGFLFTAILSLLLKIRPTRERKRERERKSTSQLAYKTEKRIRRSDCWMY